MDYTCSGQDADKVQPDVQREGTDTAGANIRPASNGWWLNPTGQKYANRIDRGWTCQQRHDEVYYFGRRANGVRFTPGSVGFALPECFSGHELFNGVPKIPSSAACLGTSIRRQGVTTTPLISTKNGGSPPEKSPGEMIERLMGVSRAENYRAAGLSSCTIMAKTSERRVITLSPCQIYGLFI